MSIATHIERIQADKVTIRTKLVELGLASNTDNLDTLAAAVEDIVNRGAVSVEIKEGTTYTIPAGYHNGSGVIKAITDVAGEAELYKTQAKTVTPTKNIQNITPDTGYYALESVTVGAIPEAYQDVTDVTAEAANVLAGKIFVTSDGTVTTGTMINNGAVDKVLSGTTISYTIPKGYHNGSGKVTIVLEEKSVTPTKSEQVITPTDGKVLSKVTVAAIPENFADSTDATATADKILTGETAYVGADGKAVKVEGTMPNNGKVTKTISIATPGYTIPAGYHDGTGSVSINPETKSATPTKEMQTINATSGKVLSSVTVQPIPENFADSTDATAVAANILDGKTAYIGENGAAKKVTGAMANNGAVDEKVGLGKSYTIPEGYHNGEGKVTVDFENKTATPTKSSQTIGASAGKALSYVTVNPIPDAYQDVTPVTATEDKVLVDSKFVDSTGKVVNGTMPNNGATSGSIDGLNVTEVTIPAGYTTGGKVTFDDTAIVEALAAI